MNSCAELLRAAMTCSSEAPGGRNGYCPRTVPEKRIVSCGTFQSGKAMNPARCSRTLNPVDQNLTGGNIVKTGKLNYIKVLFPAPVAPKIATVWPGSATRFIPFSTFPSLLPL